MLTLNTNVKEKRNKVFHCNDASPRMPASWWSIIQELGKRWVVTRWSILLIICFVRNKSSHKVVPTRINIIDALKDLSVISMLLKNCIRINNVNQILSSEDMVSLTWVVWCRLLQEGCQSSLRDVTELKNTFSYSCVSCFMESTWGCFNGSK